MQRHLVLVLGLSFLLGCSVRAVRGDDDADDDDDVTADDDDDAADDDDSAAADDDDEASEGCGRAPVDALGGVNVTLDVGSEGAGERRFHLVVPADYAPDVPHRLVVGYPGTNWVGEQIRPYLGLEDGTPGEIHVYPDPLWWNFPGWGELGGWLLGPHAAPADGEQDLVFTEAVLDYVESNYCVDRNRVFATGHSWGGDMAAVVACFLGDRFTASMPVAANRPYWFEPSTGAFGGCAGETAVWTLFGEADDHFTSQAYPGEYGDEQAAFWVAERSCDGLDASTDLDIGGAGRTVEYTGCATTTRYSLYGPATGHQVPSWFAAEANTWFRSF